MHGVFGEFALLLLMAAAAGAFALWLRQPVLIAYIAMGIVAGPAVLGVVTAHDQIDLLAQVGVAVLLFVVGLKLDLQHIRHIGPVALATGLGQLSFTIVIGFFLILAMGKGWVEALYVAVALTFSSTIIIVKLLSDKREIDSLHGRIAVGFLIVQDLAVVIAMMVMSALRGDAGEGSLLALAGSLALRIGIAGLGLYLLMRYVLPRVVDRMAQSQELLLIFAIAWGTGLASLGEWAGFSKEAGAFVAGFSLASTHYRDAINARLTGIRDFLLLFFFIDLGAKLDFSTLGGEVWPAIVLSLFVLIGNPLIVMAIMGYMGYRKRTGFLCRPDRGADQRVLDHLRRHGHHARPRRREALGLTTLVGPGHHHPVHLHDPVLASALREARALARRVRAQAPLSRTGGGHRNDTICRRGRRHRVRPRPLWQPTRTGPERGRTQGARCRIRPGGGLSDAQRRRLRGRGPDRDHQEQGGAIMSRTCNTVPTAITMSR
jgi:Kef-type K+ transport system membrane component KefB